MIRRSLSLSCLVLCAISSLAVQRARAAKHLRDATQMQVDANGYEIQTGHITAESPTHHLDFHTFVTRPDIDAPRFNVKFHDATAVAPGYWFLAPYEDKHQDAPGGGWIGPAIYDGSGGLVWSGAPQFEGWNAFDFKPTTVSGRLMLSLIWRHDEAMVLDDGYEEFKLLNVGEEKALLNMHDFTVLEDGKRALLLKTTNGHSFQKFDMGGGYHGDCRLHYYGFEEVDVATGEVVFSWSSEGHIEVDETFSKRARAKQLCKSDTLFDYVHLNSVDKFPDGDYLVNSRNCNTMYKISHKDGSVVWRFGGSKSDFHFSDLFQGQHHARVQSQNETHTVISFLDNSYLPFASPERLEDSSRGLLVSLRTDTRPMSAMILENYEHPHGEYALGRGSYQVLPNGNTFIGWTANALHTEYAADGRLVMEAQLKPKLKSYRSYKGNWVGRPVQPPDIYAESKTTDGGQNLLTAIWVSWNGATEVSEWRFYSTTPDRSHRRRIGSLRREGFETLLVHAEFASHVYAEAVDGDGAVLGTSKTFKTVVMAEHAKCNGVVEATQGWRNDSATDNSGTQVVVLFLFGFCCSLLVSCSGWYALTKWRHRAALRGGSYTRIPEEASERVKEEVSLVNWRKM